MAQLYRFPIKGSYYYAAQEAFKQQLLTVGATLYIQPEPDNTHDSNALQIWTQPNKQGYLIGYIPRQLAKHWQPLFAQTSGKKNHLSVRLTRSLAKGKQLRLECEVQLTLSWLQRLHALSWSHWLCQRQRAQWWLRNARQH